MAITTKKLIELITTVLDDNKAENIISLDIKKLTNIAKHMIISSGTSTTHVKALKKILYKELKKHGMRALGVEEDKTCEWILIDANDVIIHIMLPETREFYHLEDLWTTKKEKQQETNES